MRFYENEYKEMFNERIKNGLLLQTIEKNEFKFYVFDDGGLYDIFTFDEHNNFYDFTTWEYNPL